MADYTSDKIHHYADMEYIRQRPNGLIPDRDNGGIIHMIWEYISNSMDELILRPNGGTILIALFREQSTGRFQVLIRDNGRGIPSKSLKNAFTKLKTSGKIAEDSVYYSSGGQFGQGAKAGAALSTRFRAITKNYMESKPYNLYLNDGVIVSCAEDPSLEIGNGVTVILEPDLPRFFHESVDFSLSGYFDLVSLCRKLNVFNTAIDFNIFVVDRLLPDHVWTDKASGLFYLVDEYIRSSDSRAEYLSSNIADKSEYLFDIWKMKSTILFSCSLDKVKASIDDRLSYSAKIFINKKTNVGNHTQYFITVNNVVLPDKTGNTVSVTAIQILRELIADRIDDAKLKQFVMNEYDFATTSLAVGVMYHGAELSGTTKYSFRDSVFGKQFYNEFKTQLLQQSPEFWESLMSAIFPDINNRFASYYEIPTKKQDVIKIFMELNFPKNFSECRAVDNNTALAQYGHETELFIVEGNSAGNINSTRDNRFQAVYCTRGKPYNAATRIDRLTDNRRRLLQDPVYQDIMHILGVNPNTRDFSNKRFGKIIIATDADADGYHIRSLHLSNLYIINPALITSGMVWIANPPLYSIEITRNKYFYVENKSKLMDAKIEFIYKPVLQIKLVYETSEGLKEIIPDDELYREICYLVEYMGDKFSILQEQLNIPLLVLEKFAMAIDCLYPVIDYNKLMQYFTSQDGSRYVTCTCNQETQTIVISIGHDDYAIGLNDVGRTIVQELMPILKKYRYDDLQFMVRSVYANNELANFTLMTPMQLYMCIRSLRDIVTVHRYKGLGELETEHCLETIMDPKTRSITKISDPGDIDFNYKLMSKEDSTAKKNLLTHSGALKLSMTLNELREEE